MVDWLSDESSLLVNSRLPAEERDRLHDVEAALKELKGHIGIATSGTSGQLKWAALSKHAMLRSAAAVNDHLQSARNDIWINTLPLFHVGGLGILARSFLSGARLIQCAFPFDKWDPEIFIRETERAEATLTSLVPAHVFDLVAKEFAAPKTLRAVIVGGGSMSDELYRSATRLGWKLLPSYGMTECCSQVATAPLESWQGRNSPNLVPLDHVTLALENHGCLKIRSESLLTGYIEVSQRKAMLRDPKVDGWFVTEDCAELSEGKIVNVFRKGAFIKIGGESVDLNRLGRILADVLEGTYASEAVLVPIDDARLGHVIGLAVTHRLDQMLAATIHQFNARVFPFERIRAFAVLPEIPRSALGKAMMGSLREKSFTQI